MDENNYYKQMALVLVKMKRFQKAVAKFRETIGIPSTGIPPDERASWYQQLFIKRNVSATEMHRLFRIDVNQQTLPPNRKFLSQLKSFADSFNLAEQWYSSLFSYLVGGEELLPPTGKPYLEVRVNDARQPADQMEVTSIKINVNQDTALKDIEVLWEKVETLQKEMRAHSAVRRRQMKNDNVEKYMKIREFEIAGKTQQQIADDNPGFRLESANDVAIFKREMEKRFKPSKK